MRRSLKLLVPFAATRVVRPAFRSAVVAIPAVLALAGTSAVARADDMVVAGNGDGFDSHLFRPAIDSKGFFSTNGTTVLTKGSFSFGLVVDYGHALLRVASRGQDSPRLMDHAFQGSMHVNYGLANIAVVGLSVPVNLTSGAEQVDHQTPPQTVLPGQWSPNALRSQNVGFLSVQGKLRILRVEKGFGLALGAQVGLPVNDAPKSGGADPGFFFWPQLIGEKRFGGSEWLKVGVNAGFRGHAVSSTAIDLAAGQFRDGNRVTYGLGLAARVAEPLDLVVDTYGTYLLSDSASPVKLSSEITGGIKLFFEQNSYLMLGGGPASPTGSRRPTGADFLGLSMSRRSAIATVTASRRRRPVSRRERGF